LPPVLFILVANLTLVWSTLLANLPLVWLIPVVHLDLRISPQIFEKILNDPEVIAEAWGKMIRDKNLKQKISWHSH
jgi:hypothetical protein